VKVICGLGNPGPEYQFTRHNVGWWVTDRLAARWNFGRFFRHGLSLVTEGTAEGERVVLLKPLTYMNRSGAALLPLLSDAQFNVTTDLLVVVDDTALPIGRLRFRPNGSPGGHNGLKSVEATLGTREYARLRIGIGARPPEVDLAEYVLTQFEPEEEANVLETIPRALDGVACWLAEGVDSAMRKFNH
jgi:peptidyl-tRNA hydrolase, PTH1 family